MLHHQPLDTQTLDESTRDNNAARPAAMRRAAATWQSPEATTRQWRTLVTRRKVKRLPKGVDALWHIAASHLVHAWPRNRLLRRQAKAVLQQDQAMQQRTGDSLQEKLRDLRAVFRRGRQTTEHEIAAFAAIREAAYRTTGMRPYPVQLQAAIALSRGWAAEVATGEGKSLIGTLPAVINGWRGDGCHVMTVNDYLARRDAEAFEALYRYCGLSVGWVEDEMEPRQRQESYAADVTYLTHQQACADFLRDQLTLGRDRELSNVLLRKWTGATASLFPRLVMRGLACAIVDEADSVLLDESTTPLIISGEGKNAQATEAYAQAAELAEQMQPDRDYKTDKRFREVRLTVAGRRRLEDLTQPMHGLWHSRRRAEELVAQALTARELFLRDEHYVVLDDKAVIVDEATGRLMPDRTWRDGLHEAVQAKEKLEVQPAKVTLARISFQRFFRMYRRISGMSGTAWEARFELWQLYGMPTVRIPTHRPVIRKQSPDVVFAQAAERWQAVADRVQALHAQKVPVLVGTRSVEASEKLSDLLQRQSVPHQVLNAVRHEQEADIVAEAGRLGAVTIATNMAGRGTDIKLQDDAQSLGGLHVIATERHSSRRIDRQLFGRAGRQGDPGHVDVYISLEDELFRRYGSRWLKPLARQTAVSGKTSTMVNVVRWLAQQRAERMAFSMRRQVLRTDDWLVENLGFAGQE